MASTINDAANVKEERCDPNDDHTISNLLVTHLLHLQDLKCFENMWGENKWGYQPYERTEAGVPHIGGHIEKSLETGEFVTPHCYESDHLKSVIRITATGRQLLEALKSQTLEPQAKKIALQFGGRVLSDIGVKLFTSLVS